MTASEIRLVPSTDGAKVWRTKAAAYRAACEVAAALGTGANRLGESGRGNVAVGCVTQGEYVVCVRTLAEGGWRHEWVAA